MKCRGISCFLFLFLLHYTLLGSNVVDTIIYSFEAQGFNRSIPVGKPFVIKGTFPDGVDRIKIETKTSKIGGSTVTLDTLKWSSSNKANKEFVLFHQKLYWERKYKFKITHSELLDISKLKAPLVNKISNKIQSMLIYDNLEVSYKDFAKTTKIKIKDEIKKEFLSMDILDTSKLDDFLDFYDYPIYTLLEGFSLDTRFNEERIQISSGIETQVKIIESKLQELNTDNFTKNLLNSDNLQADQKKVKSYLEKIISFYSKKDFKSIDLVISDNLPKIIDTQSDFYKHFDTLSTYIISLENIVSDFNLEEKSRAVSEQIVEELELKNRQEKTINMTKGTIAISPSEERKHLLSLDVGVVGVPEFESLLPAMFLNFKLFRRKDFEDPYDNKPEVSLLTGINLVIPDNSKYADYKGLFNDKPSLLVGLGIRSPKVSKLLMLNSGIMLYNQKSPNPLSDETKIRGSFFAGLAINIDVFDYAKTLTDRIK